MVHAKGSTLLHRLHYLDKKSNPIQKAEVLGSLKPELQKIIQNNIIPAGWYPLEYLINLMTTIDKVVGKGDLGLVRDIGYFSGIQAVSGLYKMFIKIGSVSFVIKKAANVWRQLFDSGNMVSIVDSSNTARFILSDFEEHSDAFHLSIMGWIQSVAELSGVKDVKTAITKWPSAKDNQLIIALTWK